MSFFLKTRESFPAGAMLAVDEIEALSPNRETDGNNSGERLSVLLSVITGEWKNLYGIDTRSWSDPISYKIV